MWKRFSLLSFVLLTVGAAVWAQTVGNGSTQIVGGGGGGGGVKTSAGVVALFTGCSGTQYLGADGACHSASGAVTSVFTRTGAVAATTGDYTCAQVTNCSSISGLTATFLPIATSSTAIGNSVINDDGAGDLLFGTNGSVARDPFFYGLHFYVEDPNGFQAVAINTDATATFNVAVIGTDGISGNTYATATNCAAVGSGANPSVAACGSAAAGMFSCATNASTATCQVNTSAVTANSEVLIVQDAADGGASQLNVTCNTGNDLPTTKPILLSKSAGTSFTINVGTISANPACFEYHIIN